jgi:hypothetical protein
MKFHKMGNVWSLTHNQLMDVRDRLDPRNYTVCRNPMTGEYYLEESEPFILPSKIYGKTGRFTERILRAFETRQPGSQVGVFLSGTKGSGKTLLAKNVANLIGLPTIIINTPYTDDRFMRVIQGIEQPAVIIFDEFEKVYKNEDQESILTLFDGVYTVRDKVMIITCNDKWEVKDFFHNRPGRLRYAIEYFGLEREFIEEYCENLNDRERYQKDIVSFAASCDEFNFDMLQALVDELNRFGGSFREAVEILNVKPVLMSDGDDWTVTTKILEQPERVLHTEPDERLIKSPMSMFAELQKSWGRSRSPSIHLYVTPKDDKAQRVYDSEENDEEDDEETPPPYEEIDLSVHPHEIVNVDAQRGVYVFHVKQDGKTFEVSFTQPQKTHRGAAF